MEIAEWLLAEVVGAQRRVGASRRRKVRHVSPTCLGRRARRSPSSRPRRTHASLAIGRRCGTGRRSPSIAPGFSRSSAATGRRSCSRLVRSRTAPTMPHAGHLLLARAAIYNYRGEWSECLEAGEHIARRCDRRGRCRVSAPRLICSPEWCCTALGLPGADQHAEAAEQILIELDDSIGLANLFLNRGVSAWQECRVVDAVADSAGEFRALPAGGRRRRCGTRRQQPSARS